MPIMLNKYLKNRFGCKVYKLALNAQVTCPNRDGKIDDRGCIFCSKGGSGEFAPDKNISITEQIQIAKQKVAAKIKDGKYIAYFQSYTNTYAPIEYLEKIFTEAALNEDIVALSIATRPDCLGEEVISLLDKINKIKPVWVELGLQTIHSKSIEYIRRGYDMKCFEEGINKLNKINVEAIIHVILGLPGESREEILESVKYIANLKIQGVKFQMLHVLKDTDLEKDYIEGKFELMDLEEYVSLLKVCVELLPEQIVIHRLTGDGPKNILIAPKWSGDKKRVLNSINKSLKSLAFLQ